MNFKEIYKSANNEISGDRSLIDAVIKKAEKKPVFKMAYPLACAAAALVIVAGISVYPKNDVKPVPNTNIASNKKADINVKPETSHSTETDIKNDAVIAEKSENTSGEFNYSAKKVTPEVDNTPVAQAKMNADDVKDTEEKAIVKEEMAEIAEPLDDLMLVMLEINDINASVPYAASLARSSGGGGGALAKSDNVEFEGMTKEQYYEYIGTDITRKIELPEGMQFEEFFGATVKRSSDTKNVISDNAEFYASGENKYVSLTTSKLAGYAEIKLADETLKKSDIFGTIAVVEGYEATHRMYIKYADVYYNIYTEGLTPEEIEKILISICKN